jgi:hypothetical protein
MLQVNYFIQNLDQKDTLEPLGFEGQLSDAQLKEQKKAAAEARKALAAPPAKPTGRVIIVGAGPAGLAAATQLQVRLAQQGMKTATGRAWCNNVCWASAYEENEQGRAFCWGASWTHDATSTQFCPACCSLCCAAQQC